MEKSTVKELRVLAKRKGITPIPGRKADLIAAIEKAGDRSESYTIEELKALCMKNKDVLGIRCGGKGITYEFLLEKLLKAGIIMVVESPASEFEEKLLEADPKLHSLLAPLVLHLQKLGFLLLPKLKGTLGRKQKDMEKDDPWRFLYSEYSLLESSQHKKWKLVINFMKGKKKVAPKTLYSEIRSFVKALPLISYAYALSNAEFRQLADELNLRNLFEISEAMQGTTAALPALNSVSDSLRSITTVQDIEGSDVALEGDITDFFTALPEEMRHEILRRMPLEVRKNSLIASRALAEGEERYRVLHATYGALTLSLAQNTALEWIYERMPEKTERLTVGVIHTHQVATLLKVGSSNLRASTSKY